MIVKQPAVAGTLESSDIQISIFPNPGNGLDIQLQSIAKAQFGDSILETVNAVLAEFEITDAVVSIVDKGAFDWVIRSRMQTVCCLASESKFNWKGED